MSRYAVLRFFPKVTTGEGINVGLALWDKERIMWTLLPPSSQRLRAFAGNFRLEGLFKILDHYSKMSIEDIEKIISLQKESSYPSCLVFFQSGTLGAVDEAEMNDLAKSFLSE